LNFTPELLNLGRGKTGKTGKPALAIPRAVLLEMPGHQLASGDAHLRTNCAWRACATGAQSDLGRFCALAHASFALFARWLRQILRQRNLALFGLFFGQKLPKSRQKPRFAARNSSNWVFRHLRKGKSIWSYTASESGTLRRRTEDNSFKEPI